MSRAAPVVFELSTRFLLSGLGPGATLDAITATVLDALIPEGTDIVWLLGVWETGDAARAISRADAAVRRHADELLGTDDDDAIAGSPFAITGYAVAARLGGADALDRLRARLAARGLRLMLDFIPNHTAPDHPWVWEAPDLYVCEGEDTFANDPGNWRRVSTAKGDRIMALGRDPYFPGWADTLQLDWSNPETQARMAAALADVARHCDGVRVDMAMLVLPEVFRRTWQREAADFWPDAINRTHRDHPGFVFLAEVYWGLEEALTGRGFDLAYDKELYDGLAARDAGRVRASLGAPVDRQSRLMRFVENHDENRAAAAFPGPINAAASTVALLAPGARLLHQGQIEGFRRHVSMHLGRGPDEPVDAPLASFLRALLHVAARPPVRDGRFAFLEPEPAWSGNPSHAGFVLFRWSDAGGTVLVAVNYAPDRGQCRVFLDERADGSLRLRDLIGTESYERDAAEVARAGLYLDLPSWGLNVFAVD